MIAKKSLGQHWLDDEASLKAICDAAQLTKNDTVLEIGPGTGTLTRQLVKQADKVIAIEKDEQLAKKLSLAKIAKNLQIVRGDILKFDLRILPKNYKIAANIPYYLTNHLFRMLGEAPNQPSIAVLLVQKEVAQRVAAKPSAMSLLSVSVQFYYEARLGQVIPAELFTPPPKVDSQILVLNRRHKPLFIDVDSDKFFQLVKAGFSARRKKLRSSLSGGLGITKPEAENLLQSAGIDPNYRAQELSLDDWHQLYKFYIT